MFHNRILEFQPNERPFETLEEMHEEIIDRHNAIVKPKDNVFFVGDVVFGYKNLDIVDRFNGNKYLIVGNHDNIRSYHAEYLKHFTSLDAIREFGHGYAVVSHYPVHPNQLTKRYRANIHGHMHDNKVTLDDGTLDDRYYSVCLDANDLRPTAWEDIMTHINTKTTRHDK